MQLNVIVKPRAHRSEILEETSDSLKVAIKAQPQDGKANLELIKLLSKHFNAEVTIVAGKTSKKKLVRITPRD